MICPDCHGNLLPVSLTGFDESYRCRVCGGFWLLGWTLTKAGEEEIDKFTRLGLKADPSLTTNKCPTDGSILEPGGTDAIPQTVTARKCVKCNWWWLPGDSLFDYRAAMQAKKSYLRWWGKSDTLTMTFLPALLVLLMIVGGAYLMKASYKQTQFEVPARNAKVFFSLIYAGSGNARINVSSREALRQVTIHGDNEAKVGISQTSLGNGVYQIWISGLTIGQKYTLVINGNDFEFVAK